MFGFLGKIKKGLDLYAKVKVAIDEGKDVIDAIKVMEEKYSDLDDDAKEAWREVREFIYAIKQVI